MHMIKIHPLITTNDEQLLHQRSCRNRIIYGSPRINNQSSE
jgi:hypothetical protein